MRKWAVAHWQRMAHLFSILTCHHARNSLSTHHTATAPHQLMAPGWRYVLRICIVWLRELEVSGVYVEHRPKKRKKDWQSEKNYSCSSDPNLYFFQNHPIRYFCLAGIILSRDEYENRTCLVLDDNSGVTLQVNCAKQKTVTPAVQQEVHSEDDDKIGFAAVAQQYATPSTTRPLATSHHVTASTSSPIDISSLQPCTRVKVKGILYTLPISKYTPPSINRTEAMNVMILPSNPLPPRERFRYILNLDRFQILPDLASEIRFWNERTSMLTEILCLPWHLTQEEVRSLKEVAEEEAYKRQNRAARLSASQRLRAERARRKVERDEAKLRKRWLKEEVLRKAEDERVRRLNQAFQERLMSQRSRNGSAGRWSTVQ